MPEHDLDEWERTREIDGEQLFVLRCRSALEGDEIDIDVDDLSGEDVLAMPVALHDDDFTPGDEQYLT